MDRYDIIKGKKPPEKKINKTWVEEMKCIRDSMGPQNFRQAYLTTPDPSALSLPVEHANLLYIDRSGELKVRDHDRYFRSKRFNRAVEEISLRDFIAERGSGTFIYRGEGEENIRRQEYGI